MKFVGRKLPKRTRDYLVRKNKERIYERRKKINWKYELWPDDSGWDDLKQKKNKI